MKENIKEMVKKGYVVLSETKDYITLREPKKFNWGVYITLSILLNLFGLIGYPIYYSIKKGGKEITIRK